MGNRGSCREFGRNKSIHQSRILTSNRLDVFVLGSDHRMLHSTSNATVTGSSTGARQWSDWNQLGSQVLYSKPTAASTTTDNIHVFSQPVTQCLGANIGVELVGPPGQAGMPTTPLHLSLLVLLRRCALSILLDLRSLKYFVLYRSVIL
jgi:hypothetical protein